MKIDLTSVFVDDQAKALRFYTEVLGFVKKVDIPAVRWITVVSPEDPDGTQVLLEPNENPAARAYQEAIYSQGIPATSFGVDDIRGECERLVKAGVTFIVKPTETTGALIAVFDDTCGNLIQLHQVTAGP
ncbi:MAG: VOC family protein [Bacillota bacterium]